MRFADLLGLALSALWQQKLRTALTTLGVDLPGIDVWNFGVQAGRIIEILPTTGPDNGSVPPMADT